MEQKDSKPEIIQSSQKILELIIAGAYIMIAPSLIFTAVYFNILGIPSSPKFENSLVFIGRMLAGSTVSNAAPIVLFGILFFSYLITRNILSIFIVYLKDQLSLSMPQKVRDFLKEEEEKDKGKGELKAKEVSQEGESPEDKELSQEGESAEDKVDKSNLSPFQKLKGVLKFVLFNSILIFEKYLSLILYLVFIIILLLSLSIETLRDYNSAISFLLLFFSIFGMPLIIFVLVHDLFLKLNSQGLRNPMFFNLIGLVIITIFLSVITSESYIKNQLNFPQTGSRQLRIWINEEVEYTLDCSRTIGTIYIKPSPISKTNLDKDLGALNGKEVNTINADYAEAVCNRAFSSKL